MKRFLLIFLIGIFLVGCNSQQPPENNNDDFNDIKARVKLMPDPKKVVIKRVLAELNNEDKYKLFVGN